MVYYIGAMLDIDFTLVIQFVIFITFSLVMYWLVFKPYLQLYQLRQSKTEGLDEKAGEIEEKAEKLTQRYRDLYESIYSAGKDEREAIKKQGQAEAGKIVAEARKSAALLVEKEEKVVEEEFARSVAQVDRAVEDLTRLFIERVKSR